MDADRIDFGKFGDRLAGEGGVVAVVDQCRALAAFPATGFEGKEFLHPRSDFFRLAGDVVFHVPLLRKLAQLPATFPGTVRPGGPLEMGLPTLGVWTRDAG